MRPDSMTLGHGLFSLYCRFICSAKSGYKVTQMPGIVKLKSTLFKVFIGSLMTSIIRIFLTVTLKMLITFNVFKTVLVVIVYGVMVMHGFCIRCQEVQNIVIIKALHVLMRMRCIVSNEFISIEPTVEKRSRLLSWIQYFGDL